MKTIIPGFRGVLALLLVSGICIVAVRSADSGRPAKRPFTKGALLEDLAQQVILPAYSNFAERAHALTAASGTFATQSGANSLKQAQSAWIDAMLAWRSAQVFRSGPLTDQNILSRIHFWPIRRQSVDNVLRATNSIDEPYLAQLGASAVGLCALEYLLFDLKGGDDAVLAAYQAASGERRKTYLRALTADLARQAQRLLSAWTQPGGYAGTFIASGQDGINLVVNDLLQALEIATEERLRVALDMHQNKVLKPEFIQNAASGISHRNIVHVLDGAHRLYAGSGGFGLVSQLEQIQSPVAGRGEARFQEALKAMRSMDAPLEKTLLTNRTAAVRAYDACKKLEVLLKVEMAGALGVTLTFNSTDGD
jgi:predicted lipoprotein